MSKKNELTTFTVVKTDEEFLTQVTKPGLRAKFAGPCEPIAPILKRIKVENGDKIGFLQCESDQISCLEGFRDQSCPCFVFIINRILVRIIRGANAPQIEKTIKDHIELEDNGQPHNLVDLDDLSGPIVAFIAPAQSTIQPESEHETEPERDAEQSAETDENGDPQVMTVPLKGSRRVSIVLNDQIDADVNALLQAPLTEDGPVENTLAMLKPDAMYPIWLTADQAEELYKESVSMDYFERLVEYMSCAPVLAIELSDPMHTGLERVGWAKDPRDAKKDSPNRCGMYGQDRLINSFHASDGPVSAERELAFLFTSPPETFLSMPFEQPTAEPKGSNYNGYPKDSGGYKAHAMLKVDSIISKIVARGIQITKREEAMLSVERAQELSVEFLETPAFEESVQTLTSGPLLLLTLKAENVIEAWLEMLGPSDPETAKTLFPHKLEYGSIFKTPIGSRRASQAGSRNLLASESVRSSVVQLEKERHRLKSAAVSMYARVWVSARCIKAWRNLMGPTSSKKAREEAPNSIRALFGTDILHNACHGSDSPSSAAHEIGFFFGSEVSSKPVIQRTMALIKPDAYPTHKNDIVARIIKMEEFYKDHAGKPFFEELTTWMSSAPIYGLVLERPAAIIEWRNLMGHTNSNIAREVAPYTIRAHYGTDGSHNAVHGSDSPENAAREIMAVFGNWEAEEEAARQAAIEQERLPEAADVTEPIPEDDATKVPQEPKTPRPPSSGNPNPRSKSTIKKSPSKPALKSKSPSTVNVGGLAQPQHLRPT
ncbi:nucleoside diphosphate kinase [Rhizoclosmatium globosum]|uniref:Nucleoside diphosphate kinase n=1 Tax=Rhizoclosmatium globosum TaxID=329046 RepID=A0A1Y2CFW6_9FUNG|nr:nucleoside diphosphate kinase [Rhizoclosmatium globosum]|eukprot:ORY45929.1 nucleoside diphosphate kinase [Rhizoclosmatium globosum]